MERRTRRRKKRSLEGVGEEEGLMVMKRVKILIWIGSLNKGKGMAGVASVRFFMFET